MPLDLLRNGISEFSLQHFILIGYLFMGICKPNRNKRAHLKDPLEKENPNPNDS